MAPLCVHYNVRFMLLSICMYVIMYTCFVSIISWPDYYNIRPRYNIRLFYLWARRVRSCRDLLWQSWAFPFRACLGKCRSGPEASFSSHSCHRRSPCFQEPGEGILHVDVRCHAAFDEGIEECHEAFLTFKWVCRNDGECAFRHGRYGVFTAEFKDSFTERPEDPSAFSQIFVIEEEIACKSPVSEQSFLMEEVGIKPDFRSPKEFRTELGQAL